MDMDMYCNGPKVKAIELEQKVWRMPPLPQTIQTPIGGW